MPKKKDTPQAKEVSHIVSSLRVLSTPTELINIDPDNPREGHDLQGIADSLEKYGQRKPIIVNKKKNNYIEAGTGTFRAATELLHWTHIAAVFVEDDHDASAGYNLADNRLTDLSFFNPEKMIEMALSVDDNIPGMETIKEMITTVEDEPEFSPEEEEDESIFTSTLCFDLSPEDYGKFIIVRDKLGLNKDEPVFLKMLEITMKELKL